MGKSKGKGVPFASEAKALKEYVDENAIDLSIRRLTEVPFKGLQGIRGPLGVYITTVDLSTNLIKSLPADFGTALDHLVKLDLSQNQLEALPDSFGAMSMLERLDREFTPSLLSPASQPDTPSFFA